MPKPRAVVCDSYFRKRSKISDNGCWEWKLHISNSGYGQAKVGQRFWNAHRLSWAYYHGSIPDGMIVCHKCDNRKCVNPNHLFVGTTQDNVDDKMRKGRFVAKRGENSGTAKLTEDKVIAIRCDPRPQAHIARDYGISQSNVCLIKTGKAWAHIGITI